ncbi:conserved hypothetical protein [Burkholderia diffusa]|uniref:DUF2235 domain-containing protein n=1 Tax=Burkholderia diffusa TaxID=488732 RepID=UPI001CB4A1D0|nr:DUF2235 domain-containing protein [Burkholderia diffusa]CAG9258346.1 conserved hypothetical protein [Burkholderia diffusa]
MSTKQTASSASAATESSPAMADRVARAISVTRTQPSAPPDGCYRCHQEIYISFFFDGFGHSLKDGDSISNVGRLYNAHKATKKEIGIYSLYYEGMGRPLSKETTGIAGVFVRNAIKQTKELAVDAMKEGVTEPAKEVGKESAKKASLALLAGKEGGVKSTVLHALGQLKDDLRPSALAKSAVGKIASVKMFTSVAWQTAAESIPGFQNSELGAAWLGTGFEQRVERASDNFREIVKQAKIDPSPIKFIRVSMFGYDRGAVAARKFANELIEKICKKEGEKITYQGAEVVFDFMGLFDSVSSGYGDTFFAKVGVPLLTAVTSIGGPEASVAAKVSLEALGQLIAAGKRTLGEYDTPGEFRKVVHHVAATELRFYKPLDSPRNSKEAGNLTEIVYPGSQADVGGGFVDGDDGKSPELAKVSARNMLDQAWACGVPFYRVDELKAKGQRIAAREFDFQKTVQVNGKTLTVNDLFGAYASLLPSGKSTLEHQLLAHQKLFISWARTLHDRAGTYSTGSQLFVNTIDTDVYKVIFPDAATPNYHVRADYYNDAEQGKVRPDLMGEAHTVDDIHDPTIRELATSWVKPAPLPPEVTAFFDHFVHNTITRSNNVSLGDGVFLQLRRIEDKGLADQMTGKAKDAAVKAAKKTLPNPDQVREEALKRLKDAGTWSQGAQLYPDPLQLGSPIGDTSPLNNLAKE